MAAKQDPLFADMPRYLIYADGRTSYVTDPHLTLYGRLLLAVLHTFRKV